MKGMGSRGAGIKLTTGETIGGWTLDDHDGQRERMTGGDNPATTRLPKGDATASASASTSTGTDVEADAFADRWVRTLGMQPQTVRMHWLRADPFEEPTGGLI